MPAPFHNTAMADALNAQQQRLGEINSREQMFARIQQLERRLDELEKRIEQQLEATNDTGAVISPETSTKKRKV